MSHLFVRTLAAMAFGVTLLALPQPANAAGHQVTFSGTPVLSVGLLSCPSTPDTLHLDITAGTAVTFINHLGRTATLHVGSASRQLADKASTAFTFNLTAEGLTVYMVPSCAMDTGTHTRMTIDINPAATTTHAAAPIVAAPVTQGGGKTGGKTVISQETNVNASGGGAAIAGGPIPSGVSTVGAGGAGGTPVVITNNRDLINMIVLLAAILTGAAVCSALLLWRRLPSRHVRVYDGGDGGGGLHLVGKDATVPEGQAAQIFNFGRAVGRKDRDSGIG